MKKIRIPLAIINTANIFLFNSNIFHEDRNGNKKQLHNTHKKSFI